MKTNVKTYEKEYPLTTGNEFKKLVENEMSSCNSIDDALKAYVHMDSLLKELYKERTDALTKEWLAKNESNGNK